MHFLNEKWISIKSSLKFIPDDSANEKPVWDKILLRYIDPPYDILTPSKINGKVLFAFYI